MNRWETQLRKGVVELAILAAIGRGETYGYRIVEQLKGLEGLELTESTVYPVLTRLAGWVSGSTHRGISQRTNATVLSIDRRGAATSSPFGGELEDGFSISQ